MHPFFLYQSAEILHFYDLCPSLFYRLILPYLIILRFILGHLFGIVYRFVLLY